MKKNGLKTLIYVSAGAVLFIIVSSFILGLLGFIFGFGYGMMGGGMMMGMMGAGGLFLILPIIGIALLIYFAFNDDGGKKVEEKDADHGNPAIFDLDRRYATGELTREQYLMMKGDILRS